MESLQQTFKKVKDLDWSKAISSFYIVKRKLVKREANYQAIQVNTDESLRKKLRRIAVSRVSSSNSAREYEYTSSDLDNDVLAIGTEETDLEAVLESISAGTETETASKYEDLVGSWMYISRLDLPNEKPLYSARRVSESWTSKKVTQLVSFIFKENMLIDLKEEDIFRIDSKVDFFSFDGTIFIADKKNFEAALNFREGMERNRDEIVAEFQQQKLFVNAEEIATLVGNNIRRLRKLSQVKKSGYYKNQSYLKSLRKVNEDEDWGLAYDESGKIQIAEENIELALKLLNNDRLHSLINEEDFDVDVKHKIGD